MMPSARIRATQNELRFGSTTTPKQRVKLQQEVQELEDKYAQEADFDTKR